MRRQSAEDPRPAAAEGAWSIETCRGQAESSIKAAGRVVIDTSPDLRTALRDLILEQPSPVVVVDMTRVERLDTSGIATLLEGAQLARARSVSLRVVGLSGEPKALAEVTELDRIFSALGSRVELG